MINLPYDILNLISEYINFYTYYNLAVTNKNLYNLCKNDLFKKKINASYIIIRFFYKIKLNYSDLRLSRKGYLINYNRLLKHPEFYLNKKIQFISSFQYYHYNVRSGEIGEGTLFHSSNNNSWFIKLDNSFYNYNQNEPIPTNHLLYRPFIVSNSVRVIKS